MVTQRKKQERAAARERRRASRASPEDAFESSGSHARPGASNPAVSAALDRTELDRRGMVTLQDFEAATRAPGSSVDFGGRVLDLSGAPAGGVKLTTGNKTISNCTITHGAVLIQAPDASAPPTNFFHVQESAARAYAQRTHQAAPQGSGLAGAAAMRFVNVAFLGSSTAAAHRVPQRPDGSDAKTSSTGLVLCAAPGATVVFERCTFANGSAPDAFPEAKEGGGLLDVDGLHVNGGDVHARDCTFVNNMGSGLLARGRGVSVSCANCQFVGNWNSGAHAQADAQVTLASCTAEANGMDGVFAGTGADVRASATRVRHNARDGAQAYGGAAMVLDDGCEVLGNRDSAVFATERGAITANDVTCVDNGLVGVFANAGGSVRLRRCAFRNNGAHGVLATDAGSKVRGSDVELRGHREFGVRVVRGAHVAVERSHVVGNGRHSGIGVGVTDAGSKASLKGVEVTEYKLCRPLAVVGGQVREE